VGEEDDMGINGCDKRSKVGKNCRFFAPELLMPFMHHINGADRILRKRDTPDMHLDSPERE
jgi:hypothetical protein